MQLELPFRHRDARVGAVWVLACEPGHAALLHHQLANEPHIFLDAATGAIAVESDDVVITASDGDGDTMLSLYAPEHLGDAVERLGADLLHLPSRRVSASPRSLIQLATNIEGRPRPGFSSFQLERILDAIGSAASWREPRAIVGICEAALRALPNDADPLLSHLLSYFSITARSRIAGHMRREVLRFEQSRQGIAASGAQALIQMWRASYWRPVEDLSLQQAFPWRETEPILHRYDAPSLRTLSCSALAWSAPRRRAGPPRAQRVCRRVRVSSELDGRQLLGPLLGHSGAGLRLFWRTSEPTSTLRLVVDWEILGYLGLQGQRIDPRQRVTLTVGDETKGRKMVLFSRQIGVGETVDIDIDPGAARRLRATFETDAGHGAETQLKIAA